MRNLPFTVLLGVLSLPAVAAAQPHDVNAGPIWNQGDAERKCPSVCRSPERWNGQWRTTVPGKMSVCGCFMEAPPPPPPLAHGVSAGPTWN
jgi:Mannan-binding protein